MPNIITHILFTDDVYEKLDDPKYDFLESRLQLMEVGGNGPDFLFFHNLSGYDDIYLWSPLPLGIG